mgnify:FL=1
MKITSRTEGQLLVFSLDGEMDHHNLIDLAAQTDPLIKTMRPQVVLLDLRGVPFCDSSGIAAVLGRYKLVRNWGGKVVLHGLSPQVRKVLGLGGVFNLVKEVNQL